MAKSQWFEYKEAAVSLRKTGMSMTVIERKLGIPRSTLSGWFRDVILTEDQRVSLMKNKKDGWLKARTNAVISHRAAKEARLTEAKQQALDTLDQIDITDAVLDLAFAMLYLGEGAKSGGTSIASSDPKILRFVIKVLKRNYSVTAEMIRCDLHLRMDQDANELKHFWSKELGIPLKQFKYVAFDKRSTGKATYQHYKGVCVVSCGNIAIQRKLMYLYTLFCERIAQIDTGA
jgi:hypothetical protein